LRHPIIEKITEGKYIPNDIVLGKGNQDGILLYGLNSVGKSSLMKSIGIAVIMSQIGFYVPAFSYKFKPYNALFTRISSDDNLFKGLSSFALEITELNAILKRCGKDTLVIADEVCKGTEHRSAITIVTTMLKILCENKTSMITATHLHELAKIKLVNEIRNLHKYHLHVEFKNGDIIFDRKLRKGNGIEEYGLQFSKHIIDNMRYNEVSMMVKNELEKDIMFTSKQSNYNSTLLMDKCHICNSIDKLETHHIKQQKDANEYGFVIDNDGDVIHKDNKDNLVVLCEKCHDKLHDNKFDIEGHETGIKGKNAVVKKISTKRKTKKYDDDDVKIIYSYKEDKRKMDVIKNEITGKIGKKISKVTIKKIFNNNY